MKLFCLLISIVFAVQATHAGAASQPVTVPLVQTGLATYNIEVGLLGHHFSTVTAQQKEWKRDEYLVDSGAGYMTITEAALKYLKDNGMIDDSYLLREIDGRLANGTILRVQIYNIGSVRVGNCVLQNVEAAVIPGATRGLFGLSAFRKAKPFHLTLADDDSAYVTLSNCSVDPQLGPTNDPALAQAQ